LEGSGTWRPTIAPEERNGGEKNEGSDFRKRRQCDSGILNGDCLRRNFSRSAVASFWGGPIPDAIVKGLKIESADQGFWNSERGTMCVPGKGVDRRFLRMDQSSLDSTVGVCLDPNRYSCPGGHGSRMRVVS
jgi:hypothetical protein